MPYDKADHFHSVQVAKSAMAGADCIERLTTILDKAQAAVPGGVKRGNRVRQRAKAAGRDHKIRRRYLGSAVRDQVKEAGFVLRLRIRGNNVAGFEPSLKPFLDNNDVLDAFEHGPSIGRRFDLTDRFGQTRDGVQKVLPSGFESFRKIHPAIVHAEIVLFGRRRHEPIMDKRRSMSVFSGRKISGDTPMKKLALFSALTLAFLAPLDAQQDVPMRGNTPVAPQGIKTPPLPMAPIRYETGEGQNIRVAVHARGFTNAWSLAPVSNDTILVAERAGTIRAVRNGIVDPQPVSGGPVVRAQGLSGMDLALHPGFAQNRYIYISYTKPLDQSRTALAVARAVWDGRALTGTTDVFVGEGGGGGPIAFGGDGMLYISSGGGGDTQSANSLGGKILRLTDSGGVPPDNPFVGRANARPEVFTMGHRNTLRMAMHPGTGAIWQVEMGPNGGDEVNILVPGANYGWPLVSLGRTYGGPWQGPFTKEGFRDPVIFWMPSIAASSIAFYTGDRLPKWKGDIFVGGMRYGEIPGSGRIERILINKNLEELRREPMLLDLHQRIRDVKQGRDGLLYLLTDGEDGAILRIEPEV